jgi:hypothetical protein
VLFFLKGGEKRKMKRRIVLGTILALSLIVVILATCFAPVFAATTYSEHLNAQGASIINVPGHPTILVIAQHYDQGDFYKGSADRIQLHVSSAPSGTGPPFKWVAAYEDNPTRYAFSLQVDGGSGLVSHNLVNRFKIQTFRIDKTVFVYWTLPLTMPATTQNSMGPATPAVTLPPGCLMLKGYGDATPKVSDTKYGQWNLHQDYISYQATATLLIPGWRYFGPGSEEWNLPSIRTEGTFTWTGP